MPLRGSVLFDSAFPPYRGQSVNRGSNSGRSQEDQERVVDRQQISAGALRDRSQTSVRPLAIGSRSPTRNPVEMELTPVWFVPNSEMTSQVARDLAQQVALRFPSTLLRAISVIRQSSVPAEIDIGDLALSKEARAAATFLQDQFNLHGSDKSTLHDYHLIYGHILNAEAPIPRTIIEIGLGTTKPSIASNMGEHGRPGASLKAFQSLGSGYTVIGADIDRDIKVENIATHYVDQTRWDTMVDLIKVAPEKAFLVIDDGLHSPDANLNTLSFAFQVLRPDGFFVVEDIPERCLDIWRTVRLAMHGTGFRAAIIKCRSAYVLVSGRDSAMAGLGL